MISLSPELQGLLEALQRFIRRSLVIPLWQQLVFQAVELGLVALPAGRLRAAARQPSDPSRH